MRVTVLFKLMSNAYNYYKKVYRGKKFEEWKVNRPEEKAIWSSVDLTLEQMQQIDNYYLEHYGKKIPYTWHRLYTGFRGSFDVRYFPEHLFIPVFERLVNPMKYTESFGDKNVTMLLASNISDLKVPKCFGSCCNGMYRDDNYNPLSKQQFLEYIANTGKVFIKPTVDSSSGRGCRVLNLINGLDDDTGKTVAEIVESYGDNFVIQEIIKMHPDVANLHPESVNTFRIMTYRLPKSGELHHTPSFMRIGIGESKVDNAHAGGLFIGIGDDGDLEPVAFTEFKKAFLAHPDTGIKFDGYKIIDFPKALNAAKKLHALIPQIGVYSWDFTIDSEGIPVLIEVNTRKGGIWANQKAWGKSLFGDDTEEILEFLRDKEKDMPFKISL